MSYNFLKAYKVSIDLLENKELKEILKIPHHLYTPYPEDLEKTLSELAPFPHELELFYKEIGYGFFHVNGKIIQRIVDPMSAYMMNRQLYHFKFDKQIGSLISIYGANRLLFFQAGDTYLAISRESTNEGNAIYFHDHQISNSLKDFLRTVADDKNYLKELIEY